MCYTQAIRDVVYSHMQSHKIGAPKVLATFCVKKTQSTTSEVES